MRIGPLLVGLTTFIPGLHGWRSKGTGGTNSARYCYSVWLRNLVMAHDYRITKFPNSVAELGPGDSIGVGIAALLSGVEKYFALDVVEHADIKTNLKVFDELIELFHMRKDIPGEHEFPDIEPALASYRFPGMILNDTRLQQALAQPRIENIRYSIEHQNDAGSMIHYATSWGNTATISKGGVDIIFSQAVLEHVDNLDLAYTAMRKWLAVDGFMAHEIDFRSHNLSSKWNGHWACSDFMWKLVRGRRPFLINREPHSTHIRLLEEEAGFRIVCDLPVKKESAIKRANLADRFKQMNDKDLTTSSCYIIATLL